MTVASSESRASSLRSGEQLFCILTGFVLPRGTCWGALVCIACNPGARERVRDSEAVQKACLVLT